MQELNQSELEEVNGGLLPFLAGAALVGAIALGIYIGYMENRK